MHKKVLFINLNTHTSEIKALEELTKYVGGVGVGLKLLLDNIDKDPLILSTGPLNGAFPYASKTSIVLQHEGVVEDLYIGGSLSTRLRFTGIDSFVIYGKSNDPVILDIQDESVTFKSADRDLSKLGLPGKRSVLTKYRGDFLLDEYFMTPENFMEQNLNSKNVSALVITGTRTKEITDTEKYEELYYSLLQKINEMTVEKDSYPSCSGCPVGCNKSRIGELGGNVLLHSLVACTYAKNIYTNIGTVFSCLNVLGYDYTHEDIESLPALIEEVLQELT